MTAIRVPAHSWLGIALALMLIFSVPGLSGAGYLWTPPVYAEAADTVYFGGIDPKPAPGLDAGRTQRIRASIGYNLASTESGVLMLYLFEDTGDKVPKTVSDPVTINKGSGHAVLDLVYAAPWNGVSSVALAAVLFKDAETVLVWVASEAIPVNPSGDRIAFDEGIAAMQAGKLDVAEAKLTEAITAAPRVANYWHWRGDVRARSGDYAGAVADYSQALEIAPGYRPSLVNRGVAKMWQGDWQGAVPDFNEAMTSGVTDGWTGWALRARGVCHIALGNRTQAIADLGAYLQVLPQAADKGAVENWINTMQR